ncbi:phage portal protein, partial [Falsiroseomonas sp.]|uniref:phage portal protein n=1 Tax=Falsiroseomonas sp. TaxID=2870721 RepID=UPI0034A48921
SGECFVRLLPAAPSLENPIGLRLQVLESDHLDAARQGVIEGIPTLQGIGLGEAGEPVGYWLHRVHPGASWVLPGGATWLSSQRVPARDVLHIYRKRRPGQLRDVSWLAPVLTRLRDLGDYEAALLMKAKIEACLAAVVSEDGEEGPVSCPTRARDDRSAQGHHRADRPGPRRLRAAALRNLRRANPGGSRRRCARTGRPGRPCPRNRTRPVR